MRGETSLNPPKVKSSNTSKMYLNPNKIIGSGVPVWITSQILAVNYNFDIIYYDIYIINLVTLHS